jgi:hypothetical protein
MPEDRNLARRLKNRGKRRRATLIGQRFGRLLVIGGFSGSLWLCRCDCGNERTVYGSNLKSGNSRSCGCLRQAKPKPVRAKAWSAEHRAKLRTAALNRTALQRANLSDAAKRKFKRMPADERSRIYGASVRGRSPAMWARISTAGKRRMAVMTREERSRKFGRRSKCFFA